MERNKEVKDASDYYDQAFSTRQVLLYKPGKNEGDAW